MTNHVVSGALIGAVSRTLPGALAAGGLSHFALDAVPHWGDVEWDEMVPIGVRDGLVGLGVMGLLWSRTAPGARLRVLAGMTGACLPDLDKPALLFFGVSPFPERFDAFHLAVQRESRERMPQEILVAGTLLAAAWWLLPRARTRGPERVGAG